MLRVVVQLMLGFACRLVRDVLGGPDLAVRMGIAGAHHGAAIFEDLYIADIRPVAELSSLRGPGFDNPLDLCGLHAGERQAVIGMKAENTAGPSLALGPKEGVLEILRRRG